VVSPSCLRSFMVRGDPRGSATGGEGVASESSSRFREVCRECQSFEAIFKFPDSVRCTGAAARGQAAFSERRTLFYRRYMHTHRRLCPAIEDRSQARTGASSQSCDSKSAVSMATHGSAFRSVASFTPESCNRFPKRSVSALENGVYLFSRNNSSASEGVSVV